MVSESEKRHLLESYREPVNARAAVARAVAGLCVVAVIALLGAPYLTEGATSLGAITPQAAAGR